VIWAHLPQTTLPPAADELAYIQNIQNIHLRLTSDQAQLANVHLNNRALSEDAKLRVHRVLRVLLDADDRQLNGYTEFRMLDAF
jgi:hypothetical protein